LAHITLFSLKPQVYDAAFQVYAMRPINSIGYNAITVLALIICVLVELTFVFNDRQNSIRIYPVMPNFTLRKMVSVEMFYLIAGKLVVGAVQATAYGKVIW
jgi:hypothetical protein